MVAFTVYRSAQGLHHSMNALAVFSSIAKIVRL
jgi:hypothetical protein